MSCTAANPDESEVCGAHDILVSLRDQIYELSLEVPLLMI